MLPKLPEDLQFPRLWAPQCKYCQEWNNAHETTVLTKAALLCKQPHWRDFVMAELDLFDHSKTSNADIMAFLLRIHAKTDCHCLDHLLAEVTARTQGTTRSEGAQQDQLPDPHSTTQTKINSVHVGVGA
jgi:hypothetical protein